MCPSLFPVVLIQIVWILYILFKIKTRLYEDDEFTEKVETPIWFYLLGLLISIIPALGFIAILVVYIFFFVEVKAFPEPHRSNEWYSYDSASYYYKPGWFLKILRSIWLTLQKPL